MERIKELQNREVAGGGLPVERYFTIPGVDPFDQVDWERRTARIVGSDGTAVFEQPDVEFPKFWSQRATDIVAQKYFRGKLGSPERERSVRQMIGRVADTITRWGIGDGYFSSPDDAATFRAELTHLLLHQMAAFNSPVWFNVGFEEKPQCSACFILSIEDNMESILEWYRNEGMIFRGGSGSGINLSRLRSSNEQLSKGGKASGPVSFMRGADSIAGTIKSGGKTRRAAKMLVLNMDHPDVVEFIWCKAKEEKKAYALGEAGYDMTSLDADGWISIQYQNANNSVRVTDEFMRAVVEDKDWHLRAVTTGEIAATHKARDLMRQIAEAAWECGDPGLQYDTTVNDWHTCPNSGRINASNPCCVTGDTLIAVADGRNAVPIRELVGQQVPVYAWDHRQGKTAIARMWNIGIKRQQVPIYRVTLDDGSSFRATDDHLIMLRDGSYRQVKDLTAGDSLNPFHSKVRQPSNWRTARRYVYTGQGWRVQYRWVWEAVNGKQPDGYHIHHQDFDSLNDRLDNLQLLLAEEHQALHREPMLGDNNPARRCMTDEWRAHIAPAVRGEKNPHYGKPHPPETRAKMRAAAAQRWSNPQQHAQASARAQQQVAAARAAGRRLGREPGERFERCCPACRQSFVTAREEQIFCSSVCRYSPLGLAMIGAKGGASRRGRSLSPDHREKLRLASMAAARPEDKRRAGEQSLRNQCLKAARLLMDAGCEIRLAEWDAWRETARTLGARHVPYRTTLERFFASEADLQEPAAHYNHKVVSVEFDGVEDVYDGTVDGHHNFAIITSQTPSPAVATALDYSGCFIHNSEYMHLDDSACNLGSLNLMKFYDTTTGEFNTDAFRQAVDIVILAQEIIVGNSSYPTDKIAMNAKAYRQLGLGYANLGALLMARGLPYDSDEGRAYAASITALLTGEAYAMSARIAEKIEPFAGYMINREPMLRVIRKHRDSVNDVDNKLIPPDLFKAAQEAWDEALTHGENYGYRNAQVSVLAPTGTIAFLMDCDTTGVEPDIALVKYKKLVGGGEIKMINHTVPVALRRLGYSEDEFAEILAYIDERGTIEGAPHLKLEHLPVFDCAFRPANGTRSIHYLGHIRMMGAVQPFISGAISKCITGDSIVLAEDGMIPLAEIVSLPEGTKPDTFIKYGRRVFDGQRLVEAADFYYNGEQDTIRLDTVGGFEIEGTPNHQVRVFTEKGLEWKHLGELKEGDCLAIQIGQNLFGSTEPSITAKTGAAFEQSQYGNAKTFSLPKRMSKDLARLLGYLVADGSVSANSVIFTQNGGEVLDDYCALFQRIFGEEPRLDKDERRENLYSAVVNSRNLVAYLADYLGMGRGADHKDVPSAVMRSGRQCVQQFIRGVTLDGYVNQSGRLVVVGSNSKSLARKVQLMLCNLGIGASLVEADTVSGKRTHLVMIWSEFERKFLTEIGFAEPEKQAAAIEIIRDKTSDTARCYPRFEAAKLLARQRLHTTLSRDGRYFLWDLLYNDYGLTPEKLRMLLDLTREFQVQEEWQMLHSFLAQNLYPASVRSISTGRAKVYDLYVPNGHSFVANGLINHNTVNLPSDVTPDDVAGVYIEGWKQGLKAIAIYRDGSKRVQPLSTGQSAKDKAAKATSMAVEETETLSPKVAQREKVVGTRKGGKEETESPVVKAPQPVRRRLPDTRRAITHHFTIQSQDGSTHDGYITVGMYEDGSPGEIFVTVAKEGSTTSGLMDAFATAISIALQYGVPLEALVKKFSHMRFEPSGVTTNPEVRVAKSLVDYIFRWLAAHFLDQQAQEQLGVMTPAVRDKLARALSGESPEEIHPAATIKSKTTYISQADAPSCPDCGQIMVRNGSCYRCHNCGSTSGCS
jgi:ribonucleotide reductase alpha subunit